MRDCAIFPSSVRRGGRTIKKKFPFRYGAAGVVSSAKTWARRSDVPRLRRFGGFAAVYYWRSHPSSQRRGISCSRSKLGAAFAIMELLLHRQNPVDLLHMINVVASKHPYDRFDALLAAFGMHSMLLPLLWG